MTDGKPNLPHKLILNERKQLTVTGVTEVVSFDEAAVIAIRSWVLWWYKERNYS